MGNTEKINKMVRSYVADAKVQEVLNDLSSSGDGSVPLVGLVIGQASICMSIFFIYLLLLLLKSIHINFQK